MDKLRVAISATSSHGRSRIFVLHIAFKDVVVKPCPICGSLPRVRGFADCECHGFEAKAFCSNNSTHISVGDWEPSMKFALEEWNRRTTDETQPDLYKPNNWEKIRKFTPEQFARFLVWLNPNFCHNTFRPEYHDETNKDGKTYKVCAGKCTECVLRFLNSTDGIYSKWPSVDEGKYPVSKTKFDPEKDYHV